MPESTSPEASLSPPQTRRDELSTRAVWILLTLLLIWAFGLRVWDASQGLHAGRFWDERYGLENIGSLLKGRGFQPANGYHPSLSYLPQALVLWVSESLHELTGNPRFAVFAPRGFTPTTYFLCRLTQAIMGTLSLFLTFLIGRQLAGNRVGLVGAFLLAVVPWHIRQSVIYKPDILLVLTTLIAFWLSLRVVARPSLGRYLLAGLAVGVALSSKFNAGPIAIPLTVGALWLASRDRRHLWWLVSAGATSLAVFFLLNPYLLFEPEIYRSSFARTLRDYERKGTQRGGGSRINLLVHAVTSLVSSHFHGKLIGALGLVGLIAAPWKSWKTERGSLRSLGWIMLFSYVVGYVVIYAISTANPSEHNWLPLTPFLAICAAWLMIELWQWLASRVSLLEQPWVARGACGLLVLFLASAANGYVYRVTVPTTGTVAGKRFLRTLGRVEGRLLYSEVKIRRFAVRRARDKRVVVKVGPLTTIPSNQLELADGEVFFYTGLEDESHGSFYRHRLGRALPGKVEIIRPRLFRSRGPSVVLISHPLEHSGAAESGHWSRVSSTPLIYRPQVIGEPDLTGQLISLEFWLPSRDRVMAQASIVIHGEATKTLPYRVKRVRSLHLTPRLLFDPEMTLELDLVPGTKAPEQIRFTLWRWTPPDQSTPDEHVLKYRSRPGPFGVS